jgi:hypothetical protein
MTMDHHERSVIRRAADAFRPPDGRRRQYAIGGTAVLVAAVAAVARFGPPAPEAVPAAALEAEAIEPVAEEAAVVTEAVDIAEAEAAPSGRPAELPVGAADFAFPPITDGVPRVPRPEVVRGIYLNAWAAGSARKLASLIDVANRTEVNSFVIDVKEGGEISYGSQVPLARQIGADQSHIRDIRGVLRQLRENGIYPIARIVVFRDAVLAQQRPDLAVRHVGGGEWIDHYGHRWVDPYNRDVWDYNIAIAREALELGFSEVQWDYVRFPDVPRSLMRTAHFPAGDGRSRADGIREFLLYSREQLAPYGVPVTADVFGLTVSARDDMGIGQQWDRMVDATDVLLPMVYPSHFARGSYGIAHPNAEPYDVVLRAMQHAVRRTRGVDGGASIRPWLQDFTLGQPRYGPAHVRAQIDAVYAAGLREWILWHPGSTYTVEALASADGEAPSFGRPTGGAPRSADAARPSSRDRPLGTPVDQRR